MNKDKLVIEGGVNVAALNTDRELWRGREGDYYADSIHVTERGAIGINCGGTVFVKPVRDWHRLAERNRELLKALEPFTKLGVIDDRLSGMPPDAMRAAVARARAVSAIEARQGDDPQGRHAKHESAVGNADEAEAMVRYMVEGLPRPTASADACPTCGQTNDAFVCSDGFHAPLGTASADVLKGEPTISLYSEDNSHIVQLTFAHRGEAEEAFEMLEQMCCPDPRPTASAVCAGCEGSPAPENDPCAVCGKPAASADVVADFLHELDGWESAYPLSVFPEPDMAKAAELLKAGGITLDAVSASNMRHVVLRIAPKARAALPASPVQDALGYATRLAKALHEKHYADTAPDWKPLPDLIGVLTQIDNMTATLAKVRDQSRASEAE